MTGIDPTQLRELIVRPALECINLWSPAAEDLVMGTAAVESHCGRYLKQVGGGPALGIFQMEPATHDDIWKNYLRHCVNLAGKVAGLSSEDEESLCTAMRRDASWAPWRDYVPDAGEMVWNLAYAAAMARVHYRRSPEPLPAAGDVQGMARLWKKVYNTPAGAGTVEKFIRSWEDLLT
jgi:hypothetical protein